MGPYGTAAAAAAVPTTGATQHRRGDGSLSLGAGGAESAGPGPGPRRESISTVGRLSAAPAAASNFPSSSAFLHNMLSPSASRGPGAAAPRARREQHHLVAPAVLGSSSGSSSSSAERATPVLAPLLTAPQHDEQQQMEMETETVGADTEMAAAPAPMPAASTAPATSQSWWSNATHVASAAVSHTPILGGGFAGGLPLGHGQHHYHSQQQQLVTPRNQSQTHAQHGAGAGGGGGGIAHTLAAITPSAAANAAASILRTPNLRGNAAVAGLGSAFSHGLSALGLERNPLALLGMGSIDEHQQQQERADTTTEPTAIGFFDGAQMSYSTAAAEARAAVGARRDSRTRTRRPSISAFGMRADEHQTPVRPPAMRPRPLSALGLGVPPQRGGGEHGGAADDRAASYSGAGTGRERARQRESSFSYKQHFKLAYQTESNWLRGGRLLSQHISTEQNVVATSMAMDSDYFICGMSNCKIYVFDAKTGLFLRTLIGHVSGVWCLSVVAGRGAAYAAPAAKEAARTERMVVTNPDENYGRPYLAAAQGDMKLVHHDDRPSVSFDAPPPTTTTTSAGSPEMPGRKGSTTRRSPGSTALGSRCFAGSRRRAAAVPLARTTWRWTRTKGPRRAAEPTARIPSSSRRRRARRTASSAPARTAWARAK